MRRIITTFLVLVSLVLLMPNTQASVRTNTDDLDIIYLDDGGYIMVELYTNSDIARATISKSKVASRYSADDEIQWVITLSGTFTYNGTTSSCTSSNCTVTIYDDAWYSSSKTAWTSGNTAYATVEMGRKLLGVTVKRETVNLTLTCDKNGNFS